MKQVVLAGALIVIGAVSAYAQDRVEEGIAEEVPEGAAADGEVSLTLDAIEDVDLPEGEVGKYIIVPKAGSRDWALLLDTQTGRTWRLGRLPPGAPGNQSGDRWAWIPIGVCADCR